MASRYTIVLTALLLFLSGLGFAQSPNDDQDDDVEFRGGLIGTYVDQQGTTVSRVDRSVAVAWDGTAPDRRLAAGPIQSTWTGYLMSQAPGAYRLKAYFQGQLSIELDGQTVLESSSKTPRWHETEVFR